MKKPPAFADRAAGPPPEAGQATSATSDPVRMYLREIGKVPLLTAAQEVDLAMRIECGELAADLLASTERTDGLDRRRFQQVVEAVVRIRAHQLDPEQKLGREGIGRETVPRGYLPPSRTDATSFLRRVAADVDRARGKLIEAKPPAGSVDSEPGLGTVNRLPALGRIAIRAGSRSRPYRASCMRSRRPTSAHRLLPRSLQACRLPSNQWFHDASLCLTLTSRPAFCHGLKGTS